MVGRGFAWVLSVATLLVAVGGQAADLRQLPVDDPGQWRLQVSEGGQASLQRQDSPDGQALCVEWDFGALPGSLRLVNVQELSLPERARLQLQTRITAAPGAQASIHLEDGRQRQWVAHRAVQTFGGEWQRWRLLDSQFIDDRGRLLGDVLPLRARSLQLRLASPQGGRGQWCLASLQVARGPSDDAPLTAEALADTATALQHRMVDGKADTLWVSSGVKEQTLSLDLGREREIGGLVVQWAPGMRATDYEVQASSDGRQWQRLQSVRGGAGTIDRLRLGPLSARYVRMDLKAGPNWRYGIIDVAAQPAEWGRTADAWLGEVGKALPPGSLPASLRGGPVQWRVLGAPGALAPAWFSDAGVIEPLPGGFTIEPWLQVGGQWEGPGQRQSQPLAADGAAAAVWEAGGIALEVTARPGRDVHGHPWVQLDYLLSNTTATAIEAKLALLLRPFQLQPAGRRGDLAGGTGGLYRLQIQSDRVMVNDRLALIPPEAATSRFASHFDAGLDVALLRAGTLPETVQAEDAQGLASGALLWEARLEARQGQRYRAWLPLPTAGMSPAPRVEGFVPVPETVLPVLGGDAADALGATWQAAVQRLLAEQAGPWLRVDSRLALGAGNRDAMAMADALAVAAQFEPVSRWLLARIGSGSTRRCEALAHWAETARRLHAGGGWDETQLAALQPWLAESLLRTGEQGSCLGELSPEVIAGARHALSALLPVSLSDPQSPILASAGSLPEAGGGVSAGTSPEALVGGDPAADASVATDADGTTSDGPAAPALRPLGPAAPANERRQRWMAALEALPSDRLPPGWQRCSAAGCDGLADARQAADILQSIAAVLMAEEVDHLRLLPGLPAAQWGRPLAAPVLATRWGRLEMTARREGDDWVIRFQPGLQLPPAGLVIDWPWRDRPGAVSADGMALAWERGRLQLATVPAELRIALPASVD